MKKNLALIGMMGCGKTTIAKELGKLLPEFCVVDIDSEIEKSTGKKISEIFLKHGDPYFRLLESEKIKKIFSFDNQVVALGGGAFENEANRKIILENSDVIYLKTSPEEIHNRVKNESHRPLLAKNSSIERITEIMTKREPNYQKANYVVTMYYQTLYNDYVMAINSDCSLQSHGINVDTLLKYKSIASRIQKAYKYIMYITLFENPFRSAPRK